MSAAHVTYPDLAGRTVFVSGGGSGIGAAFVGWVAGCVVIWSSLFAIGNFLYSSGDPSRLSSAWILTGILAVSGFVLFKVTQQLWSDSTASQARADARAGH